MHIYPLPRKPPCHPPHPTPLCRQTALSWAPVLHSSFPLAIPFTHGIHIMVYISHSVYISVLIPQFIPPLPTPGPHVHSLHLQLFLLCKRVHLYHFSRFYTHALLYDICLLFLTCFTLYDRLSVQFCSVAQSCPTLCDPMNRSTPGFPVQHARLPCPSPAPEVYLNSCPLSRWCHPAISSSVIPFSSCPQSLPASRSFPMSQLFPWGGQITGVSASASVLPVNTQDWSPLGWTGWISLQSKGLSRAFSNTTVQKHQFFSTQLSSQSNSHIHTWPLEKPQLWLDRPLLAN